MQSSNQLKESHPETIPIRVGEGAPPSPRDFASPKAARLLSLLALAALAVGTAALGRGAYRAFTDAWIAPTELSPESREVVAVRWQVAKDKEQHVRLESELASAAAEIAATDLGLKRLRTLEDGYSKAVRWSTNDRDDQLGALLGQKMLLERQRELTLEANQRERATLERAKRNLEAGSITAAELDAAEASLASTQLARSEKEHEYLRVTAELDAATRAAAALAGAARSPSAGRRGKSHASPDVVRFDEVRINIEIQIARLEADRRAAEARERAALAGIKSMDDLSAELESTPLYLATRREIDLAFVPYAHLKKAAAGDTVYTCTWFLFGCREVGRIRRVFPGEVVSDDPWGSVARGHYVELDMLDRTSMGERTLRVRRGSPHREVLAVNRPGP